VPGFSLLRRVLVPAISPYRRLFVILLGNTLKTEGGLCVEHRNIPQRFFAADVLRRVRFLHALACHFSIIECCRHDRSPYPESVVGHFSHLHSPRAVTPNKLSNWPLVPLVELRP